MIRCVECQAEIKGNIDPSRPVSCGACTQKRVHDIAHLEKITGIDITNTQAYLKAVSMAMDKSSKPESGATLKAKRESEGLSQRILAAKLGISQGLLAQMEQGHKLLNTKALAYLTDFSLYPSKGVKTK